IIPKSCSDDPGNPGNIFNIMQTLVKRNVVVNLHISPALFEQIKMISSGFNVKEENKIKKYETSTREVQGAVKILTDVKNLIAIDRVELIFSPYPGVSMPSLLKRNYQDDLDYQFDKAKEVFDTTSTPPDKIKGFLAPSFNLGPDSYSYIKKKSDYTVVRDNGLKNVIIDDDYVIFPIDTKTSDFIKSNENSEIVSQSLIATLAQRLLTSTQTAKNIQVIDLTGIGIGKLDIIMQYIEKTPWLKPVSFSSQLGNDYLKKKYVPKATKETDTDRKYFRRLSETKEFFSFFSETAENKDLVDELYGYIITAESDYWVRNVDEKNNLGLLFLDRIEKRIESLFDKIDILKQEITLSGKAGKIPVAIRNLSGFPFKVIVELSGANFSFPDGNKKEIILRPKENVITFDVEAKKVGNYKITLKILSPSGKNIKTSQLSIKSSNWQSLITWISFILILAVILILIKLKIKKKREENE
ncbi:MAG: hypothetical protein KAS39_07950, partial [Actinomycetia bacterium]|nr:hypothetical protein [Actinomycetes bacterium]